MKKNNFFVCLFLFIGILTKAQSLSVSASVTQNVTCHGGNNGVIVASPLGGTSPYTYSWATTGGTNQIASNLLAGTYTITLRDHLGATATASAIITQPTAPAITVTASFDSIFLYRMDTLIASGAATYSWNTGDTASRIFVSPDVSTTYTVQGFNSSGCEATASVSVVIKPTPISPIGDTNLHQMYSDFLAGNDSTAFAGDTIEDNPVSDFLNFYNFWEPRLGPTGSFKVGAASYGSYLQNLHASNASYCSNGTPLSATWTELGINTHSQFTSGRVLCITPDPTNPSIMYAGGLDGGVYRSANGGANWVNMGTDVQFLDLATSDIEVEPLNHNTVYVASGYGSTASDGLYLTADANDAHNAVWTWEGPGNLSSNGQAMHQLFLDPRNTNLLYAAIDNPNGVPNAGGIWHVTNRQSPPFNWVRDGTWGFSYTNNTNHITYSSDAAFSVVGKTVTTYLGIQTRLFAAGYDIKETLPNGTWWSITGPNSGSNGPGSGLDLSPAANSTGFPYMLNASYFKDPVTGNPLYLIQINLVISNDGNYLYAVIFTSNTQVQTWQSIQYEFVARYDLSPLGGWDISPNPLSANTSTFPWALNPNTGDAQGAGCWYTNDRKALAIDPNNDNRIFLGTTSLNESTDGGVTWNLDYAYFPSYPPNGPHVDYHAITFYPGSSDLVYLGTDGGLSSFNSSTSYSPTGLTDLNDGLGLSLDYDATSSEQDVGNVWQTLQDDDANHLHNNSYTTFVTGGVLGDGGHSAVDYINSVNAYLADAGRTIHFSNYYWKQVNYIDGGDGSLIPFFLNWNNPNTMYEGIQNVYKCNDVESSVGQVQSACTNPPCWEPLSDFVDQIGGGVFGYVAVGMTISPIDSNYIYTTLAPLNPTDYYRFAWSANSTTGLGTGGGTNRTAGVDWTDATPDNSNYTMSGVAVSYTNPYKVWICYQGATDPTHTHLIKEGVYSGGSWTWTNDNTGLCDNLNVNCIVYENGSNDGLYIGTDAGVYYKDASMSSWKRLGTTFPNVIVNSLKINYCAQKLIVGTYGRGTWETDLVPSTSTPLEITSNTTWSAPPSGSQIMIPEDVEIQAPYTLTVSSGLTVNMSANHKIIVDRGATLIVDGTLTNNCGSLWAGIELQGNANADQTSANQGTVILNSGSTIENAINGITTIKTTPNGWDWSYTGGIITANGATFYNNERDIQFLYYINPTAGKSMKNISSFKNCTFEVDNTYYDDYYPTYGLQPRVTMYQVHGVSFYGNTFENSISLTNMPDVTDRNTGIYSIDASYSIYNCDVCSRTYPPGGCCGNPNSFSDFDYGIAIANSNPCYYATIDGNTFTNNYGDIDVQNANNMIIMNNTFSKTASVGTNPSCSNCVPYDLYLDQCSYYNVSSNTFSNSYYSSSNPSYGSVIQNSGPMPNLVNNNSYSGIYVQAQSQDMNGLQSYNYSGGLFYQCNTFSSSVSGGADMTVLNGLIAPNQGSCTNNHTTANNTFNNDCPSRTNILTDAHLTYPYVINYFYANASGPKPYCWTNGTVVPYSCGLSSPGSCSGSGSSNYLVNVESGNVLNEDGLNYHTLFRTQKKTLQHEKDSLSEILNRGNTSGLYTIIATGTSSTVILDSLLAPGPYLSDGVLEAAIERTTIPIETLANILIPNTPLDSSVVAVLSSIELPDTLAARLNEYQSDTIVSPRGILQAAISYYNSFMDYTDNALITAFETDSSITHPFDSAQVVLKSDTLTLARLAQLATLQWSAGENSTASATLDTLKTHDIDSVYYNYCRLMPVLMTLSSDSNGYLSLKGNSTDSILLEQIAMDTLKTGYANARAVLEFVYNQPFAEPILPLSFASTHKPNKRTSSILITTSNNSQYSNSQFNIHPNPANNEVTIQYHLGKNIQNTYIELYNEVGNKITTWQLPVSQTEITENISNLSQGFYLYTIFANNSIVQRGKLIIER